MPRDYRDIPLWKDITTEQWQDWQWQIANRITGIDQLVQVVNLTQDERQGVEVSLKKLRMAITPYYAMLMNPNDAHCPIRRQAIPTVHETKISKFDSCDPLHETVDSPVPGLTHRYPDRVLLLITDQCSMYCRHCTRRRFAGHEDRALSQDNIKRAINYIRAHKEVRDVLLSGGDALCLSDERLEAIIRSIREIKHVEIIRIGTRTPVVMPQRITDTLCKMLKKYHPIWLNTHFNHPKELTVEARMACEKLADAGIPLGNQSVLLKDINDCPYIMRDLVQKLVSSRIRPYYLYQCDLSEGIEHFRTPVSVGIEIIEMLRGHTSGLAIPQFVVDAPGGGGKIPVNPQYLISYSPEKVILRNYEGVICTYSEPRDKTHQCRKCGTCSKFKNKEYRGLEKLYRDEQVCLIPSTNVRLNKREDFHEYRSRRM
ncbi:MULTISPECIES: lysine 2,3-aminomutase [Dehalobacter]|jgi:lysine 2,3-aminomutase|uniref:L-lysine 2,3-aminomutase n=2 Tax=Dehalobacter restrictus TaxID=55583 RepID=A0A857DHG4_9FIRM|nr:MULTISPECIES: lysine 2,3-aminomutase [Dehalobacter]AHF09489.1 lysine 2,3-aminomutase [Dehalobacter restrictus DSM 9455]MDJ0304780.1 lysine 2,3-aminomutase [Dehalobacter sp.]OCZ49755.1 lysine 2,3-aminomutase [Dehalobacter sp. TeCB1]QHA00078.1 lysine 2,3-aminomutase [Dehalobacter restrictus]